MIKIKSLIKKMIFYYQDRYFRRWFKSNGDQTLRVNYSLNKDSVVIDVGGYKGDWADEIYKRYKCNIYIFEIINSFCKEMNKRFDGVSKIQIFNYGLHNWNFEEDAFNLDDKSSTFLKGAKKEKATFKEAIMEFQRLQIKHIDLMKINIEGGEYDLLEHLIRFDFIKNIKNIQIQFHNFIPNAKKRMKKIQKNLSKTHKLTYQFPFVWENWERIK